jgi:hypothetical protein
VLPEGQAGLALRTFKQKHWFSVMVKGWETKVLRRYLVLYPTNAQLYNKKKYIYVYILL